MFDIQVVHARQILDSRGNPTVEVEVGLSSGVIGRAAVPSAASTGEHEAVELRDGEKKVYGGKGVLKAVDNSLDRIGPAIEGMDCREQEEIDRAMIEMDGTANKGALGANAILGVSMACAKAAAEACDLPLYRYLGGTAARVLPVPMFNVLNGGKHADNNIDFQEFMVHPGGLTTSTMRCGAASRFTTRWKKVLHERQLSTAVGDVEGGFKPNLKSPEDALKLLEEATGKAGYDWGRQVFVALDPATSELWKRGRGQEKRRATASSKATRRRSFRRTT